MNRNNRGDRGEGTMVVMFTVAIVAFIGVASTRIAMHFGSGYDDINRRLVNNEYVSDAEIEKNTKAFSRQIEILGAGGDFAGSVEFEGDPNSLGTIFQGGMDDLTQRASDPAATSDARLPRDVSGGAANAPPSGPSSSDPRTPSLTIRCPGFIMAGQTKYVQIDYQDADNDIQTMTISNGVRMQIPGMAPTSFGGQPVTTDVSAEMKDGVGTHQITIKAAQGISGEGVTMLLQIYLTDRQGHRSAIQGCEIEVR